MSDGADLSDHLRWIKFSGGAWTKDGRAFLPSDGFKHSAREVRYLALGRTVDSRLLHVVFTIRGPLIRPIAARDMNRKERHHFAKATP